MSPPLKIIISLSFPGGDGTYHFKVLVPSVAAGAIIGKGGETIAQLQKDTGARVKMSKSHDFYPGEWSVQFSRLVITGIVLKIHNNTLGGGIPVHFTYIVFNTHCSYYTSFLECRCIYDN